MKKIANYILTISLLYFTASCEKNLSKLNVNETNSTTLDPALLLNQAIVNTSFPVKSLVFDLGIVQQMITPNGGVLAGANFNQDSRDVTTQPIWAVYYQSVIKKRQTLNCTQRIVYAVWISGCVRLLGNAASIATCPHKLPILSESEGKSKTDYSQLV